MVVVHGCAFVPIHADMRRTATLSSLLIRKIEFVMGNGNEIKQILELTTRISVGTYHQFTSMRSHKESQLFPDHLARRVGAFCMREKHQVWF